MKPVPLALATAMLLALAATPATAAPAPVEAATGSTGEWRWGLYIERDGRDVCINHDWAQASELETPSASDGLKSSAPVCALPRGRSYRPLFVVAAADGNDARGKRVTAEGFYGFVPARAKKVRVIYKARKNSRSKTVNMTVKSLPRGFTNKLKLFYGFRQPQIIPTNPAKARIVALDSRGRVVARKIYR